MSIRAVCMVILGYLAVPIETHAAIATPAIVIWRCRLLLHHLSQAHDLGTHEALQFVDRWIVDGNATGAGELRPDLGQVQDVLDLHVQLSTIALGVPAGATIICQDVKLKPATPASAMVGISGATAALVADDTAERAHLAVPEQRQDRVGSPNIIGM